MHDAEEIKPGTVISLKDVIETSGRAYSNSILTKLNDHVVRLSVMTEPYFWHRHPDSDETFLVIEGSLGIEFDNQEVVLTAGELMTVSRGTIHRTRPVGGRSINLTVESAITTTERVEMLNRI
jgi:mannose-6-phosphate isomerase-like protein (cupin superfamily)